MTMRAVGAALCVFLVVYGTVWAQNGAGDVQKCMGSSIDPRSTPDAAIVHCTRAIETGQLSQAQLGYALRLRGFAYTRKGEYDQAIQDFDQALRLNPNDAATLVGRGAAYFGKKQLERAIQDFDEANRLAPNGADPIRSRGLAYAAKGESDRAIQDFDQALRLNPNDAVAFRYRGLAYGKKGELDRAIQDFDQALRLNPNDAEIFFSRGDAYARMGQPDRAIQDYDQALRLNPNAAATFGSRGNAYARKRLYAQAIQNFDQAIRLAPNDARAYRNRARARFNKGEYQAAIPDFAEAVRLEPRTLYNMLYLYLAESRVGQNGRENLARHSERLGLGSWPGPVVSLYLGNLTPDAVLRVVANTPDPNEQRERECEASYYVGQYLLLQGRQDEAVTMFRAAIATGVADFGEYGDAQAELQRLGH
jgi:tetratricopeptide (TPR) repeat protein